MKKDKLKELRVDAANAKLVLLKDTNAAWDSASKYCECTRKVFDISKNASDEVTADTDWDSYLDAMGFLSAIKDFAEKIIDKYEEH